MKTNRFVNPLDIVHEGTFEGDIVLHLLPASPSVLEGEYHPNDYVEFRGEGYRVIVAAKSSTEKTGRTIATFFLQPRKTKYPIG